MSIRNCLGRAVASGEITREEADELSAAYDQLKASHDANGTVDADMRAKRQLAEELRAEAAEKRRRAGLQAKAVQSIERDLAAYRTPKGKTDVGEAALALLEHHGSAPYSSVEGRRKAIVGQSHAAMEAALGKPRDGAPKASTENVVRELHGEATGDVHAKQIADAWKAESEHLRDRFNRAGGAIAKLENWGLPQSHDRLAVLKAGKATWKAEIAGRLAPDKMRHPQTGDPMTHGELGVALDHVWDSIVTEGWNDRTPAFAPFGRGALATQRGEHRFLVFKSADDWLAYQRAFGRDPMETMFSHVSLMARDIAALEILGPNPNATIEWLKQTIAKTGADRAATEGADAGDWARGKEAALGRLWDHMRGAGGVPENRWAADTLANSRNVLTAAQLGSAVVSAVPTDVMFQSIARAFAGLPVLGYLRDMAGQFRGDRREAIVAGLILDSALHTHGEAARYVGALSGTGWSRRLVDGVLRWSGLDAWTQAGRHAFGMGVFREVARRKDLGFDALPEGMRLIFTRYGLDAAAWDTIRRAPVYEPQRGAAFLRPRDVAALDPATAERYLEMVLMETEYAVPSGTQRAGAAMKLGTKPGTWVGEAVRSAGQYKTFGVTFAMLYGKRFQIEQAASATRGAAFAGATLTTLTIGGAVALWFKDIVAGRDPRSIGDTAAERTKFGLAALVQGGGGGIYGDFLFADLNRFGGGLIPTMAGPLAGKISEARDLAIGNAVQLGTGEDPKFAKEAIRFAGGLVPGSSLWYLKLGYQRLLLDQLQAAADPKANQAFKRRVAQARNDLKTDYWWRPGETAPDRGPAVLGQ